MTALCFTTQSRMARWRLNKCYFPGWVSRDSLSMVPCTCHIIPVMKKRVPKEPLRKTAICGTIVVMKDYYTGEQWEAFELFISAFLLAAAWKTLEDALWALRRAVGCLAPMASREKAGINDRRQALEMKKCNCTRITAASFGCSTEASLFGSLPWKWQ